MHTIGDIARWPEADLVRRFGKNGYDLAQHARGIDNRPVITQRTINLGLVKMEMRRAAKRIGEAVPI